jgi:penicillin-binding protein 2
MLVFDELKKNDTQLRLVAVMLVAGFLVLLIGLWWVQIVSAREYRSHLETQSYRTIRLPAVRGKILDRHGRVLAENRPRYSLSLYLDDLRQPFDATYGRIWRAAREVQKQRLAAAEKKLGRSLTKAERKQFAFKPEEVRRMRDAARAQVAGNVVAQVSRQMGETLPFDAADFNRHYSRSPYMPYPILKNLNASDIARFQEHFTSNLGVDLELESIRCYPLGRTASHLLGYLIRDDSSQEGEDADYNYRLLDYRGLLGVEAGFDTQLRGRAGGESVLVNNLGYRQSENLWSPPEPGKNLMLTIDLDLQRAAERSLATRQKPDVKAAVVVMDVRSGDVLAMVSSPAVDPNNYIEGFTAAEIARKDDDDLRPQINRATQENYAPGSVFKVVTGLAALEAGLNPEKIYEVQADPSRPGRGCIYIGRRKIEDTAPPGEYNFRRALERSSNSYFITNGLRAGVDRIVTLAKRFHFGEKTGLPTRQETRGDLPSLERVHAGWRDGDTANLCIGQGEVAVTPLQMAVAYSAIANGGTVFWPRLALRIESQAPVTHAVVTNFPAGQVRDQLGVSARSLKVLRDAMLAETEDAEGTGRAAVVPGLRICGKTGTAQVKDSANRLTGYNFWFASFAPYENPRFAVIVMVQSPGAGSGGSVCAPIAHDIYEEILKKEKSAPGAWLAAALN